MGNREALLAGARKALLERGLAKVTARDIATAAGVSLAAIGYHFGSKDRLITEALAEATGQGLGDVFDDRLREAADGRSLPESVAPTWNGMLDVIRANKEDLLLSLENAVRVARSEDSQQFIAEAMDSGVNELAQILQAVDPALTGTDAHAVAKLYFTLLQGMTLLWFMAPAADLIDGDDLARAVAALAPNRPEPEAE
ncbi:helix-turn-helix domain-containing protein [Nocardia sp. NPDC024068]|uniref:TetR/AcrR family transcriptional regulator n=1 Tax=Nocardia sp. NPDC024068 TaxID=3157197 RepID=UPI0033C2A92A